MIVVIDRDESPARALDLIRAGADALVDRRSPSTEFSTPWRGYSTARRTRRLQRQHLIAELRSQNAEHELDYARILTRREKEVLALLTDGLDNRAIAADLFISEATVKFHLHNIMDKFGVHKRAALVSAALRDRAAMREDDKGVPVASGPRRAPANGDASSDALPVQLPVRGRRVTVVGSSGRAISTTGSLMQRGRGDRGVPRSNGVSVRPRRPWADHRSRTGLRS